MENNYRLWRAAIMDMNTILAITASPVAIFAGIYFTKFLLELLGKICEGIIYVIAVPIASGIEFIGDRLHRDSDTDEQPIIETITERELRYI